LLVTGSTVGPFCIAAQHKRWFTLLFVKSHIHAQPPCSPLGKSLRPRCARVRPQAIYKAWSVWSCFDLPYSFFLIIANMDQLHWLCAHLRPLAVCCSTQTMNKSTLEPNKKRRNVLANCRVKKFHPISQ
jgi:hypothetical protein